MTFRVFRASSLVTLRQALMVLFGLGCLGWAVMQGSDFPHPTSVEASPVSPTAAPTKKIDIAKMPLNFVPNLGQSHPTVGFESRGYGGTIAMRRHDVTLSINGQPVGDAVRDGNVASTPPVVVRMAFDNAATDVKLESEKKLEGTVNYFIGNDRAKWIHDAPTFESVRYRGLYDGIDLAYDGTEGRLKGTFYVRPGVDPRIIRWHYEGVSDLVIDADGNMNLTTVAVDGKTRTGILTEQAPIAWQFKNGVKVDVKVAYDVTEDRSVSFKVGDYDPTIELVIDPTVLYRTLLGGGGTDHCIDCAVDDLGNMYLTGRTHSNASVTAFGWPLQDPMFQYGGEVADAYVTKMNPSGTGLVKSTYIGGGNPNDLSDLDGDDWGLRISVNTAGEIAICGFTQAQNFPVTTNALQPFKGGGLVDGFVAVFNANVDTLIYSSYVGGNDDDYAFGVKWDDAQNLYVSGYSGSTDLPTTFGCLQPFTNGFYDGFLMKYNLGTNALYFTYIGLEGYEIFLDMAVDAAGDVHMVGATDSDLNFGLILPPGLGLHPYQTVVNGESDGFYVKIRPQGNQYLDLKYITYLGGMGTEEIWGVDVDDANGVYVCGVTTSPDYPQLNSYFGFGGEADGFCTKLRPANQGIADLRWSQTVGAGGYDRLFGVAYHGGDTFVAGLATTLTSTESTIVRFDQYGNLVTGDLWGDTIQFDMCLCIDATTNWVGVGGYRSSGVYADSGTNEPPLAPHNYPCTPGCFQNYFGGGSGDGTVCLYPRSTF